MIGTKGNHLLLLDQKLYAITPLPKSKAIPKIDKSHALSKPVTSNSVPTPTESKVVKNDNVISLGIFRINSFKASRVDNFVPNKHVKPSVRTKLITVSQPHVITKNDFNSKTNGFSPKDVKSTIRNGRPLPRNNPKNDKKQKANVSNQKKHKAQVWKPKNVGSKERLASPKPSTPRSCLRLSLTGRLFDLKGKIIATSESECQSDRFKGDNACTSNPQEPISKRKALYGLKQAPRAWYDELSNFLMSKGFTKGQSIGTLMARKPELDVDLSGKLIDQTDYHSKIGSLMYLTSSRPDIVQAYPKDSGLELTAFSDADHTGCIDTRKSTSGGIKFLGDKLVCWMSKKQDCTAMSSAGAEYAALSASCTQVIWMRTQLKDYGLNYNKILLYCDFMQPPAALSHDESNTFVLENLTLEAGNPVKKILLN
uniref:Reverse transcriptase Ty1/copia-type domain-containing protein n=1 Tax=Tanacetum cinerariifolium TaxID=118510 RepID=A0A6L2M3W0_TANCI|nr:hypothetical protein [Tanacetum cinerariifolium]